MGMCGNSIEGLKLRRKNKFCSIRIISTQYTLKQTTSYYGNTTAVS